MNILFFNKQFLRKHLYIIFNKVILDETMTKENNESDKFDTMPFIALIHHISKNRLRYTVKNPNRIDMIHEGRYLLAIHNNKNLSQDDLAATFGQSKGTIAKALRKLEDKKYVERKIDENNRRKYILNATKKGEELAILLKKELDEWEEIVGIDKLDENAKNQLRQIARKSEEIIEE